MTETLEMTSDVLGVAFRPDGRELCAALLSGTLSFWDVEEATPTNSIDGRRDIAGGRAAGERVTAAASAARKHFSSVAYSADGGCVLAGGRSRFVCIYEVSGLLLFKLSVA